MQRERQVDDLTLGTVNASLRGSVTAEELAHWLRTPGSCDDARAGLALSIFFVETPLETQVEFLQLHGIAESQALAIARDLDVPADVPLAARQRW
jgi:hypothetical protein